MPANDPHGLPSRSTPPHAVPLALNGKFLKAGFTAVHLVARQYLRELPRRLERHPAARLLGPATLYLRPGTAVDAGLTTFATRATAPLPGLLWEQLALPALARGQLLVNFCNLGPVLSRDAITFIHDLHAFETPESFSPAFVARYRFILDRIGRRHRRIVTGSAYARDTIVRYGVARPERIRVILDAVDHVLLAPSKLEVLARLGLEPQRYVLGLASTYVHKNVGVLLRAFAGAREDDPRLVLFGAADAAAFRGAGLEPPPGAVFTGWIDDGERRALYEHALCFAFPSTTEGFGLPPGEAMALGCPAIVTACGALPEVCGDEALYADPHEPRQWLDAVRSLARDPAARDARASRSRDRMRTFTWAGATDALLDVIGEVAEEMTAARTREGC